MHLADLETSECASSQPFVAHMTPAELHQGMTSGFSTIAGSVLTAYVAMGAPAVYLIGGKKTGM
jgi:nucleoside permease NupC